MRGPIVLTLLIALARAAAAQDAPLIPGDRDASEQIAKLVESTRLNGLPAEPILAKVGYATLMHAAPAKIVAVARDVAARLPIARDALQPGATAPDIAAGEGALSYGATKESLHTIRVASAPQPVVVPLAVLTQLLATGVSVERASRTVVALIKRGATAQQLASLGNGVNEDVARGDSAAAALDIRVRGLSAILAPGSAGSSAVSAPTAASPSGPKKP